MGMATIWSYAVAVAIGGITFSVVVWPFASTGHLLAACCIALAAALMAFVVMRD